MCLAPEVTVRTGANDAMLKTLECYQPNLDKLESKGRAADLPGQSTGLKVETDEVMASYDW